MQRQIGNTVITFGSLEEFAAKAGITYEEICREVLKAAVHEIGRRWLPFAIALTPVGGSLSRKSKNHKPGLMKKSWRYFKNRNGETTTKSGTGGNSRANDGYESIKNFAPHGTIIDRGRKRGKGRKTKAWRMSKAPILGSKQAPSGVTKPVWRRIKSQEREISADAIQRALDKYSKRVPPRTTMPTPR